MKIFKSNNNETTFIKQLLNLINLNIMRSIVKNIEQIIGSKILIHTHIFHNDVSSIK